MKKKTELYFVMAMAAILGILGLASCASMPATWQEAAKTIPLPDDVKIIPPSPDLPKELAAFSGKWFGTWGYGEINTILIVEEINEKEAKGIYGQESFYLGAGKMREAWYRRFTAKVISGPMNLPEIEFGSPNDITVTVTFSMRKDLNSLEGFFRQTRFNLINKAMMKRAN